MRLAVGARRSLLLVLLFIGGVERNPGPLTNGPQRRTDRPVKQLQFGVLNVRSAVNKAAEVYDIMDTHGLDVLILTETWIGANTPLAIRQDIAPDGFSVKHVHRTALKKGGLTKRVTGIENIKGGGGVAVIYRN